MKPLYLFGLCFFILANNCLLAQERPDSVFSATLNEQRYLQVYLPHDYDTTKRYDVLYVLDGEMLVRFVPPVVAFEEENELMPPVIIVGIKNNYWYNIGQDSRERDLLPANAADKFLNFIGKELVPYVNQHYATSGSNILFGHSYAGLFVVYSFLTQTSLFNHYIASDPSLWWNDGAVLQLARQRLPQMRDTSTLFAGGRNGAIGESFGISDFDSLLTKMSPQIRRQVVFNEDEHHGSVRLKNMYDGLKFTYFGYSSFMLDFFPMGGIIQPHDAIPVYLYSTYLNINPGIRYTTDGTVPTMHSPRYDYGLKVKAPSVLMLKQFSNYGPDKTASARFSIGKMFPAEKIEGLQPGGMNYQCYQDSAGERRLLASGLLVKDFQPPFKVAGHVICDETGWFKADKTGYYTVLLEAGTSCSLSVDKQLLISIDAAKDGLSSKSFAVPLAAGYHRIALEFLCKEKDNNISLSMLRPPKVPSLAHLPEALLLKDVYYSTH
ncbi:alpha/beta hydrolase-fold protein [Chitinophaga sp. Cy-1792]|uniref:alpha/beta hydrolase-fold protein n=1 Tax=Chitinophaga sp. Cy-1792 TaxID=2608339 RepID=UPI001422F3CE|nr:alpha/beta hydrolase-fold protein [Chitinophaga sp. Cy-1792]NIG54065.1 hypothetical protein [Chitinophaga sp. Cy-1792]